jgi:prevent-host-death family protein
MTHFVSLQDAKSELSALVDRAGQGEEVIITNNGVPCARLMPIPPHGAARKPACVMGITHIADDFDEPDPRIAEIFAGRGT